MTASPTESPGRSEAPQSVEETEEAAAQAPDLPNDAGIPAQSTDPSSPTDDNVGGRSARELSPSVAELLRTREDEALVTSGALASYILTSHPQYVPNVRGLQLAGSPAHRMVADQVATAFAVWDESRTPVMTLRHVLLGLALTDTQLGWELVQTGALAELLTNWQPGQGTPEEPKRVVWDILNDTWRRRAVDSPMLAAALGAPPDQSVEVAAEVSGLAFSPSGDRLAILAEGQTYVVRIEPGGTATPMGAPVSNYASVGWGAEGVVVMTTDAAGIVLRAVAAETVLGRLPAAAGARLSGDGSQVWLLQTAGLTRWTPAGSDVSVGPPAEVLSLSYDGQAALVRYQGVTMVVGPESFRPTEDPDLAARGAASGGIAIQSGSPANAPAWQSSVTSVLAVVGGPDFTGELGCLLTRGKAVGAALVESSGSIATLNPRGTVTARLAVGGSTPISVLAADATGSLIAVAKGTEVSIWRISRRQPTGSAVPGFDADLAAGTDLLGTDQRARALAALIASSALVPPLSVGLFGDWGSGKSFFLKLIQTRIAELTAPTGPPGYLRNVKIVQFNAWRYVESNLWASLVDHVLREITSADPPLETPRITEARRDLEQHKAAKQRSEERLSAAKRKFTSQRRKALLLAAGLFAVALVFAVVALAVPDLLHDQIGWVSARIAAVIALLGAAVGAVRQFKATFAKADEIEKAAEAGVSTLGTVLGRPQQRALEAAAVEHQRDVEAAEQAQAKLDSLSGADPSQEADEETKSLARLLNQMAGVTEFREQLTLVSHAHDLFKVLDDRVKETLAAIRAEESSPSATAPSTTDPSPGLQRVVVIIDDLDRCPPTKVVDVLEAIHLLFDFQMFVVLMAVDTRWLEQSLMIRHRELLGAEATASPQDYLEKVVQIPVQLSPLTPTNVRDMIAGLTATPLEQTTTTEPADTDHPDEDVDTSQAGETPVLTAVEQRPDLGPVPADVLSILSHEASALAAAAPLVGRTPRTVKRFVNTYKIIKASLADPSEVSYPDEEPGPAKLIAFLLALVTSRPELAHDLLGKLQPSSDALTLGPTVIALEAPVDPTNPAPAPAPTDLKDWLDRNPDIASVSHPVAHRWAVEVARFSFKRLFDDR